MFRIRYINFWFAVWAMFLVLSVATRAADSVTLAWNASADSSVIGYRLYYGTLSGTYAETIDAGAATSATASDLSPSTTYYFAVTAYDASGLESPKSTEVSYNAPPATSPPLAMNDSVTLSSVVPAVIDVLANDEAGSGGTLTVQVTTVPQAGTATVNSDQTVTYTPGAAFAGTDSFVYTISNGQGTSSATVSIVDPMLAGQGTYRGLILNSSPTAANTGSIQVTVQPTGKFTGKTKIGSTTVSFSGTFDANGNATVTIPEANANPMILTLQLDGTTGALTGSISQGTTLNSSISANQTPYSASNPAPQAGAYTVLLPASTLLPTSGSAPDGNGYGRLTVAAAGTVTFSGKLGDGTALSFSGNVSNDGTISIYSSLYSGTGFIAGTVTFESITTAGNESDFDGALQWLDANATGGFLATVNMIGSTYVAPSTSAPNVSALLTEEPTAGAVTLSNGNLQTPVVKSVTISTSDAIVVQNRGTDKLAMRVTGSSGLFSGSFYDVTMGTTRTLTGVAFQKRALAAGLFGNSVNAGSVVLTTSP
ncbi:MAG TPA: Ig-like domain-containing protein, partial [Chthoniobacteraceae bacterium]